MSSVIKKADYLFLDCERADVFASDLVSITIVSIDGLRYFYGECDILPKDPTPWVGAVVYPLLERGSSAMSIELMATRLKCFLKNFDAPLTISTSSPTRTGVKNNCTPTGHQ
jgi:hypothetical protein